MKSLIYWLTYTNGGDNAQDDNRMPDPKPIFTVDSSDVFWYYEILVMKCLILRLILYDLERIIESIRNDIKYLLLALAVAYAIIVEPAYDALPAKLFMWGLSYIKMDVIFLKYVLFVVACVLSDKCLLVLDSILILYACKQVFLFPLQSIACITVMLLIGPKFILGVLFLAVVYDTIYAQNSEVKSQQKYYLALALTIFLKHVILPEFILFFDSFLNKLQQ